MDEIALASAEDCRPLFDLMAQVRALAPWVWMDETQLFGVQDPDTGEIGFVSLMGMAGEHFAVGVYRGARGLYGFWYLQESAGFLNPQDLLNTPQLQASFEDRDMLETRDRDLIKTLGLKFRGRNAWPLFRSYRPGYAPWFVEAPEARFLAHALSQILEVAPRVRQKPEMLDLEGDADYFVRVPQKNETGLTWRDEIMTIELPSPIALEIAIEPELVEAVSRLPRASRKLEADFFMSPEIVGERNQRPYFPYLLMIADAKSGMVVGMELLAPIPSPEAMWGQLGITILRALEKIGFLPAEIRIQEGDDPLYGLLTAFGQKLGFKVKQVQELPKLDAVLGGMMGAFGTEDF